LKYIFLQEKEVETTEQKGRIEDEIQRTKPNEKEVMPKHQHCPHAKHREDMNPKYHKEHQKDAT
jgi:hypothetical protein